MQFLLFIAIIFSAFYIGNSMEAPANVQREIHAEDARKLLNDTQSEILINLEKLNRPVVSQFVSDWRAYYTKPNQENINELKIIEQRILINPSSAESFTYQHHKEKADSFNSAISGFAKIDAKPGL